MDGLLFLLLIVQASVLPLSYAKKDLDTLTGPRLKQIKNLEDAVTQIRKNQHIIMRQIEVLQMATHNSKREQNNIKVKGQLEQPFSFAITSKSKSIPAPRHGSRLKTSSNKSKGETKRGQSIKVIENGLTSRPLMQNLSEKQAKSTSAKRPQAEEDNKIASIRMQQKPPTHSKPKPIIKKNSGKHANANISRVRPAMPEGKTKVEHTYFRVRPSGKSAPVFGNTSVADINTKEERLYLVMSNKRKLVRVSLDGSVEPMIKKMPFVISSLAYDSPSHTLFWLSNWKNTAGQFDAHYTPDTLWHFPTSSIAFTIDQENRIMYLLSGQKLETVNLESKHLINETREIMATQLAVRIGMNGKLIANSRKRSVLVLRESGGRVMMYEVSKTHKRMRLAHFNFKSVVYLQEGEQLLYCDDLKLMSLSLTNRQTKRMWLQCPPNVIRLLHNKGTLCAITKERVYTAKFGKKHLSKPSQSQMTPLEVDKDLISPVAELIDL